MDVTPYLIAASPSAMVGGLFWLIATGRLVTRREADGIERRSDHLESALEKTQAALAAEQKTTEVVQHFFESLGRGADL